jgi:hypothetical protein
MSCAIISQELVITNNIILASLEATNIVIGGGTCADATAVAKDSVGGLISTTNIPSGVSSDIIIPNSGVQVFNTDSSFVENLSVRADSSFGYQIPNTPITVKDQGGNTLASESVPSAFAKDIVVASGGSQVLYAYPYDSFNTAQDISYAVGDDKSVKDTVFIPEVATWDTDLAWSMPVLNGSNFSLLVKGSNPNGNGTNFFGNLNRFTDINGLQVYADGLYIDHYTGMMIYTDFGSANRDFLNSLLYSNSLTIGGYSDFHWPNTLELLSIMSNVQGTQSDVLNYPPFNTVNFNDTRTSSTLIVSGVLYNNRGAADRYLLTFGTHAAATNCLNLGFRKAFQYNATTKQMELT